jgi:hypothetical protein
MQAASSDPCQILARGAFGSKYGTYAHAAGIDKNEGRNGAGGS